MTTRRSTFIPLLLLAGLTGLAAGCVHRTSADPDRLRVHLGAAPPDVGAWPSREPQAVFDLSREIGVPVVPGRSLSVPLDTPDEVDRLYRTDEGLIRFAVCRGVYGQGVVYENALAGNPALAVYYVIVNDLPRSRLDAALASAEPPADEERQVTRWTAALSLPRRIAGGDRSGPWPGDQPRGLVVHQVSSDRQWHEQSVIEALLRRGWAVLTVIPHGFTVSFSFGSDSEVAAEGAPPTLSLLEPDEFAATLEHYLVDSAYAVESILAYLAEERPEVPQDPLVLVGFSLGALGTPTVAARLEGRANAVVLVGGGVNLAAVALDSDLFRPAIRALERRAGPDAAETLRSYPEAYLRHSRFDPYHTAPGLAGTPVLLLHASFDRIVPAGTGDLLYERLARPDRWSYDLGHFGLFLRLPSQAEDIADWIDRAVSGER